MDDGEMSRQTTERMKGVFAGARTVFDALNRKVTQYDAGKEVAPGITSVATPGHTPGHMSYVVASGDDKVLCAGRRHQRCRRCSRAIRAGTPSSTRTRQMAEATRRKVYDMLAAEKMMVQGFHYPFPAHGLCREGGYRLPGGSGDVELRRSDASCHRRFRRPPAWAAFSCHEEMIRG